MRAQLNGAEELVAQVVTHPGTSHSGRSLTSIYRLAIRVFTFAIPWAYNQFI